MWKDKEEEEEIEEYVAEPEAVAQPRGAARSSAVRFGSLVCSADQEGLLTF